MKFGEVEEITTKDKDFEKYVGLGAVRLLAVNPDKEEFEALLNRPWNEETTYLSLHDGVKVRRLDFIVETVDNDVNGGIKMRDRLMIFLREEHVMSKDGKKVQVIDEYGETQYVLPENAEAGHFITMEDKGNFVVPPFRKAYRNEDRLVKLLKAFLGIPRVFNYNKDKQIFEVIDNPQKALLSLDTKKYFTEDVTDIRNLIGQYFDRYFKLMFTVTRDGNGNLYQSFWLDEPMSHRANKNVATSIYRKILRSQAAGYNTNIVAEDGPLKVFNPTPTNYTPPTNTVLL